jgi:hypothetical protein
MRKETKEQLKNTILIVYELFHKTAIFMSLLGGFHYIVTYLELQTYFNIFLVCALFIGYVNSIFRTYKKAFRIL